MTSTVKPDLKLLIPHDLLTFNTKERNLWGIDRFFGRHSPCPPHFQYQREEPMGNGQNNSL